MSATTAPTRALLSVSDKSGLVEFARRLRACGVELISTGGTARALVDAGLDVTPGERVTGAPEMLDGRVKTLHPAIHGGILADLSKADHAEALKDQGYAPIDVVCVNLYPFEKTAADPNATRADLIENIDVGGPTMIRAAAKNHTRVFVVIDPSQYDEVARAFESGEPEAACALRERLAVEAFARLSRYDAAIAARLGPAAPSDALDVRLPRAMSLRYGENPHQRGAFYAAPDAPPGSIAGRWRPAVPAGQLSAKLMPDSSASVKPARSRMRLAMPAWVSAQVPLPSTSPSTSQVMTAASFLACRRNRPSARQVA